MAYSMTLMSERQERPDTLRALYLMSQGSVKVICSVDRSVVAWMAPVGARKMPRLVADAKFDIT
jgi:hypothetical protein